MIDGITIGNIMIDCKDAQVLCDFYSALLGWQACTVYGLPAVRSKAGEVFLFAQENDYTSPIWPEQTGCQQKQVHIDFQVPNIAFAVAEAVRLGAVKAEAQFGGAEFVTLFDPAGHPFCLCDAGNQA